MLLDPEVGRRVGRVGAGKSGDCATSRSTALGRAGQESAERTTITWKYQADSESSASRVPRRADSSNYQPDSSNYQPDSSNYQLQADNPADNPAVSFVVI